jgi:hypothetical protein
LVVVLAAAAVTVPLTVRSLASARKYPGTDVQSLAAYIEQHEQPGDHVFVSELLRYSSAL